MGSDQEERHARQALDQEGVVILRGLVDPVEIPDDDDKRPALATGHSQGPDGLEGLLALVLGVQVLEALVIPGQTEELAQKRKDWLQGRVELVETLMELLPELQRVGPRLLL